MFSLDRQQDLWPTDDVQGGSLVSSTSAQSRSEFEAFASAEPQVAAKQQLQQQQQTSSRSPSAQTQNGTTIPSIKVPTRAPGVIRTGETRNGQGSLPPEKAFSIQIGWRLFRLSGASIMSDGDYSLLMPLQQPLTSLEPPHISPLTSRSKFE